MIPPLDALVIVPTLGTEVLLSSMDRLFQHLDGKHVHVVVGLNPKDPSRTEAVLRALDYLWKATEGDREGTCSLTVYSHGSPCGFGGAINRALRVALGEGEVEGEVHHLGGPARDELPPTTVLFNDDLQVSEGWLSGLIRGLHNTDTIRLPSEVREEDGLQPARRLEDYGRLGMVGPVSNVAAGIQVVQGEEITREFRERGPDGFTASWREEQGGEDGEVTLYATTFLSGFCMALADEFVEDMWIADSQGRPCLLDEETYPVGGYEDNDLAVRADRAGWRAAVVYSEFVAHLGHQTFDAEFPEAKRGMANRLAYYDKWRPEVQGHGDELWAVYRVKLAVPHDVDLFRMAMASVGQLVDGVVILLTGEPAEMASSEEWSETVPEDAKQLVRAPDQLAGMRTWARKWLDAMPSSRKPELVVELWDGDFNERDERNRCLALAEEAGADWIISVDHDEVLEPRTTRAHLSRLMRHPDPLVSTWDFSWINHWANNRWMNITPPWGDGGTYTGGMHGYRLYRVNPASPRRIMAGGANGLHCGNIPQGGMTTKRISGLRFRHFGYMRIQDRRRKMDRYNAQDPTPNPMLIGGKTYAHITHEENQLMTAYSPINGIGVHALVWEGEDPDDVARHLDQLYGVADRIVLVWTGEWREEDRASLYEAGKYADTNQRETWMPRVDLWAVEEWPETGPGREMARVAEHFGVEWVHQPLNDHIAEARNAGIDALHGTNGMGWGYFFDPDEHTPPALPVYLRRMGLATDCWGWMFRFDNPHHDGRITRSESVRMHRLDSEGIMRMNGRVHESFGKATRFLTNQRKMGNIIRLAPEVALITNTGLTGDPEKVQDKLDRYRRLCEADLREDPYNASAWTTLGLYWANEGYMMVAMECFSRGMMVATGEHLPYREAAVSYARLALGAYEEAEARMGNHPGRRVVEAITDFLGKAAPPLAVLGVPGRQPLSQQEAMESLPPVG